MSNGLQELLSHVSVEEPVTMGQLQVFGLRWTVDADLGYMTLDEAMTGQSLVVEEVSESGSVPTLKVTNRGDAMVFLMAGELLVGAKQNRVLNASLMVDARSELPVPVSCVERGRWGYRSRRFADSGSSSHARLRAKMSRDAMEAYREHGRPSSKQGEVWREVNMKLAAMGSSSDSDSLHQAYEDHRAALDQSIRDAKAPEGCCGVVFAFGGRIAGADLFDKPSTLAKLWPKVLKAYAIDAMERREKAPEVVRDTVEAWLRNAHGARCEQFKSPGLGDDVRMESPELIGAGLVLSEHPVHVELFPGAPQSM